MAKTEEKQPKRELPYSKLEKLKYELSLLEHMEGGLSISEARIFMFAKLNKEKAALREALEFYSPSDAESIRDNIEDSVND